MEVETVGWYLASRRARIAAALEAMAARRGGDAGNMDRIVEFCLRGKMIRGCLVFLGAEAALSSADGAAMDDALARLAAAMELFQAGLLAHDDIMDRDETRRGAPTIHARYAAEALADGASDYFHVGESLGICLGDLCYFEAFAELARAVAGARRGAEIQSLCAECLAEVAAAQMEDVRWGAANAEVPEADILAMYRSKTARYSFSLPLAIGALFAGDGELERAEDLVGAFTEFGEHLGILFQIRDDELGLFGSPKLTGKPLGSDLREGKKTLFRSRLLAAAPREEQARLLSLFGGTVPAGPEDIAYIRRLAEELGVMQSIGELSREAEDRAKAIVEGLRGIVESEAGEVLEGLVGYVTRRNR